jgi:hypothetical protein
MLFLPLLQPPARLTGQAPEYQLWLGYYRLIAHVWPPIRLHASTTAPASPAAPAP